MTCRVSRARDACCVFVGVSGSLHVLFVVFSLTIGVSVEKCILNGRSMDDGDISKLLSYSYEKFNL